VGEFAEREKKKSSSFFGMGRTRNRMQRALKLLILLVCFALRGASEDGRNHKENERGSKERERNSKEKEGLYVSQRSD